MSKTSFTGRGFLFGAYSRYNAREFSTRFGTVEWHVSDAETECLETGLPAVIRQFDCVQGLDSFVDSVSSLSSFVSAAGIRHRAGC